MTIGTRDNWRVPTQKEMMQAYVNRIWSLKTPMDLQASNYYSATTVSGIVVMGERTHAFAVKFGTGGVLTQQKDSDANRVLCVR